MQTQSFGGSRYFITFTDDYSRYCRTYFLKSKSEALEKFKGVQLEDLKASNVHHDVRLSLTSQLGKT